MKCINRQKFIPILLISMFLLASCQPTPQEPIVVNKGDGKLQEIIQQTAVPAQPYLAPEHWQENSDPEDKLSLNIDAQIILPDVDRYPVVRLKPVKFTQEQADKAIQFFIQGKTMYKPVQHPTKAEIENEILSIQQSLSDPSSDFNQIYKAGTKDYEDAKARRQADIEYLQSQYIDAPTGNEKEIASPQFVSDSTIAQDEKPDGNGHVTQSSVNTRQYIAGEALLNKSSPAILSIVNYVNADSHSMQFFNFDLKVGPVNQFLPEDPALKLTISQDDARKIAENAVGQLGISDMKVADTCIGLVEDFSFAKTIQQSDLPRCYVFNFTKTIQDVGTTYEEMTPMFGMSQYGSKADTSGMMIKPYLSEQIQVCVDDSGIIEFTWSSPTEIAEVQSENVELLPFDQIQDIFRKQIVIIGAWGENPNIIHTQYNITKVTLGMMRVQEKDKPNSYLMIPVWDFFGSRTLKYDKPEEGGYILDENNEYEEKIVGHSFMTINAIDGSIINRGLGY